MVPGEANAILTLLSAGFPRQEWAEANKRLWRIELAPVGAHEGMAAAREVIRNHEFLSFKAFFDELAHVREHHSDRHRDPNLAMTALESGERWLSREENGRRMGVLASWVRQMQTRDKAAVAGLTATLNQTEQTHKEATT